MPTEIFEQTKEVIKVPNGIFIVTGPTGSGKTTTLYSCLKRINTIDMKLLREVSDALHRIDHDHYGICMECDEPISAKRLEAVPWARYCVTCQERIAARIADGEVIDEYQQADR